MRFYLTMLNFDKVFIVGVAGAGLNAIANALLDQDIEVTGSDAITNNATDDLIKRGLKFYDENDYSGLNNTTLILISSAVKADHPIFAIAKENNIPIITRHELFAYWSDQKNILALSGSHGKTTTTGMTAHILKQAGRDDSYIIGIHGRDSGYYGKGSWLAIEADEYAKTFLSLKPKIALINNIDRDHVDIYPTDEEYYQTFREFVSKTRSNGGQLVINADDAGIQKALDVPFAITFGVDDSNDFTISDIIINQFETSAKLRDNYNNQSVKINLKVLGKHNIYNAVASIICASLTGIKLDECARYLESYEGVNRRQQKIFENENLTIFNDYAHSPAEVKATIEAFKAKFGDRRIIFYFQPHTFSRVISFFDDFANALSCADIIRIGDVYGSRESGGDAKLDDLLTKITSSDKKLTGNILQTFEQLKNEIQNEDIVVIMSAGNGSDIAYMLKDHFKNS
jgi:UDP-N-acetylmuramate--alanine ligase